MHKRNLLSAFQKPRIIKKKTTLVTYHWHQLCTLWKRDGLHPHAFLGFEKLYKLEWAALPDKRRKSKHMCTILRWPTSVWNLRTAYAVHVYTIATMHMHHDCNVIAACPILWYLPPSPASKSRMIHKMDAHFHRTREGCVYVCMRVCTMYVCVSCLLLLLKVSMDEKNALSIAHCHLCTRESKQGLQERYN